MHKPTTCAIAALYYAIGQTESLIKLSESIEDESEKAEALRIARKSAKRAKRLHSFLSKYAGQL